MLVAQLVFFVSVSPCASVVNKKTPVYMTRLCTECSSLIATFNFFTNEPIIPFVRSFYHFLSVADNFYQFCDGSAIKVVNYPE